MGHLPAAILENLHTLLPKAGFIDASRVLSRLRAVKTSRELQRQQQAYRIAEEIYREVFSMVRRRPGEVTVGEIRAAQFAMATRAGCPPLHFGYVFPQSPSKRAWDMSVDWKTQTIDRGDALLLDLGLIWRGYTTDFGRNATVGPASPQLRHAYAKMVDCRQEIASILRPGVAVREAFASACVVRKRLGLPPVNSVGHSLGIECHEHPILSNASDDVLEEGMTIVIELVDYAGDVAFLLEDAGLVTPRGWESMTRMGTELVEL
jgi:Xaa-Pro dipeptidase